MTEHEKYQEHIRHTHDAFCKTVIRHAAIDAARSIRSRRKREISLEYLIEEKHYPFSTTDKYFAEQSGMTSYPLFVCGQMVLLESPELAAALSALSQIPFCLKGCLNIPFKLLSRQSPRLCFCRQLADGADGRVDFFLRVEIRKAEAHRALLFGAERLVHPRRAVRAGSCRDTVVREQRV